MKNLEKKELLILNDNKTNILNSKQYDFIKWLSVVLLPAFGTLYFALSQIWGLPYGEAVLGTLAAIQVFIGATMGISSKQYEESGEKYSGEINVKDRPEKLTYSLALDCPPEDLKDKEEVTFKVNSG